MGQTSKVASDKNGPTVGMFENREAEADLDQFTKIATEVNFFYRPELDIPVGGGAFRKQVTALRGIPIELRRRPPSFEEPEKEPGYYYIIRVTRPLYAVDDKRGNEKGVHLLNVRDHVWADERYDFKILRKSLPYQDKNGRTGAFEVYYKPTEKIPLKGGKTKWRGDLRIRALDDQEVIAWGLANIGSFSTRPALTSRAAVTEENEDDHPGW